MSVAHYIRELTSTRDGAHDLSEKNAHDLFAAMLDGGVPDLELGACLMALRIKSGSAAELLGFYRATSERLYTLRPPATSLRPLVFATYNGARHEANLLPLLVLLLQRIGIPVLLHGTLEGSGRVASVYILRELGVLPSASLAHAQKALDDELLAFVPTAVLCPGLANLLSLRNRLGVRNPAHHLVQLLDPFEDVGLRVVSAGQVPHLAAAEVFLAATGFDALLLRSTEGESFASPRQRPKIQLFRHGEASVLFEQELAPAKHVPSQPASIEAAVTAQWIRQALAGRVPVPHPLVNQLACCLYAAGYTEDMNQAKAIAAVEAGGLTPSTPERSADMRPRTHT
ncbi:MAG TPA: DNA-binding protein YbiB [Burkholderiales bacterium]|jgi:anthranilate phosphoribosyltransferase|nr:DNA-binding protein YbiB [Burkholderiales bacterium]